MSVQFTYKKENIGYFLTNPGCKTIDPAVWHRDRIMGNGMPQIVSEYMLLAFKADDGFGNLLPVDHMLGYNFKMDSISFQNGRPY